MNTEAITRLPRFARITVEHWRRYDGRRFKYRICYYSNQEDDGDGGFVGLIYQNLFEALLAVAIFGMFGRVRIGNK
jgi:hypothetical protein